ncbi:MAG TPA: cytochrome c oxidase subunit II [Geminicoccaceae bacterium]|nr:cytochrome c oxidase subunit II [Geminicoccaceae bacterium]
MRHVPIRKKPAPSRTLAGRVASALLAGLAAPVPALAAVPNLAEQWQLWHPTPATTYMEGVDRFHFLLLLIMIAICTLVAALLVFAIWRFHESRRPVPSKTSHNTVLEIAWTLVPVLILIGVAIPSFRLLYYHDVIPETEVTVKITGHQWYWDYEFPDHEGLAFSSIMIPETEIAPGQHRLLEVDNRLVLPVDTPIRLQITAADVIHAWTIPAAGTKIDAIPGRLNEGWIQLTREGTFYGQCSEICGTGHAYMPIAVEVVSRERFQAWIADAATRFAAGEPPLSPAALESRRSSVAAAPAAATLLP